jgi:hypothetical protein
LARTVSGGGSFEARASAAAGERRGRLESELFQPALGDPGRQREGVGEMGQGVALERGERNRRVLRGQASQHGVDQARRSLDPRRPQAAHGLVHGCGCRHAVGEEQLIGPETQRRGHEGLEPVEIAVEDVVQEEVDPPAPAQRPVDQLRCQGAVPGGERAAPEARVEQDVRVGTGAGDAFQHAEGEQSRSRRCSPVPARFTAARARPTAVRARARLVGESGLHG